MVSTWHKNLVKVISFLAFFLVSTTLFAQQWYFIGSNADGDQMFVDVGEMKFDGPQALFWLKQDYKTPKLASAGPDDPVGSLVSIFKRRVSSELMLYRFDCNQSSATKITRTRIAENGDFLDSSNNVNGSLGGLEVYPPNSIGAIAGKFVCNRGRKIASDDKAKLIIPDEIKASKWRMIERNGGTEYFLAEDKVIHGTDELLGITFIYLKQTYNPALQIGSFAVFSQIFLYAIDCNTKTSTHLGNASYGANGFLAYRQEDAELKKNTFNPGTTAYQVIEDVCKSQPSHSVSKPEKAQQNESPTATEGYATGTAWLTSGGYFVTAYHVIAGTSNLFIYGQDKKRIAAKVVAADQKNDVAILSADIDASKIRPIPIAKSSARLGARVFTIGFPHSTLLGVSPKVTSGEISGTLPLDPTKLLISVPVQSGNSGGPLINYNGEAVGLVIEKLSAAKVYEKTGDVTENTNFALRGRYIEGLLEGLPDRSSQRQAQSLAGKDLQDLVEFYKDSVFFVIGITNSSAK